MTVEFHDVVVSMLALSARGPEFKFWPSWFYFIFGHGLLNILKKFQGAPILFPCYFSNILMACTEPHLWALSNGTLGI